MPPFELDDKNGSSDSSVDDALDVTLNDGAGNGAVGEGTGADSSDAQGENAEGLVDTASIVRDVVGKRVDGQATASPAEGSENGTDKSGQPKEEDNDGYSDVPFHKHPRFQHLIRSRDALKAPADEFGKVKTFMDENNITSEQGAEAFAIAAAINRGDAAGAWTMLKPIVQKLLLDAGEVLPPDLQARVDKGEFTPEAAAELARAQGRTRSVEAGRTFDHQRQERKQQRDSVSNLTTAASDWQADRTKKDPNFAAKMPLLQREVAYLIQTEGKPDTPEGVKAQLEKAYKAVGAGPVLRKPANSQSVPRIGDGVRKPAPNGSSSASGNSRPAPKNTLDIIRGIRAARGQ